MKLSFSTLGCPDWSFQTILTEAERFGYNGIEIRGIENVMDVTQIEYFKKNEWKKTKRLLNDHNLEIMNFGTSAMFHDSSKWESSVREAKSAIDVAEYTETPFIRMFGDSIPSNKTRNEAIKLIAEGWHEVYQYSEGKNVTPLVEVHGHFNNIEIFQDILKIFGHKKFSVLWDIEHSYKVYENNFIEFFGFIRKYVKHVHIKDTKCVNGEWKLQNLGKGSIPIAMHVMLLAATNYNGYLSLEWEKKWHPELDDCSIAFPEYIDLMRKIIYVT